MTRGGLEGDHRAEIAMVDTRAPPCRIRSRRYRRVAARLLAVTLWRVRLSQTRHRCLYTAEASLIAAERLQGIKPPCQQKDARIYADVVRQPCGLWSRLIVTRARHRDVHSQKRNHDVHSQRQHHAARG